MSHVVIYEDFSCGSKLNKEKLKKENEFKMNFKCAVLIGTMAMAGAYLGVITCNLALR